MDIRKKIVVIQAVVLGAIASPAEADWSFGGYYESLNIHPKSAFEQGVKDNADVIGINAAYKTDSNIEIGMGLSLIMFDDSLGFSQTVEGAGLFNSGDVSTESSSADGGLFYVDIGPRFEFIDNTISLSAKVGISVLDANRSISNCSDCYSEDIDLDSGAYVSTGAGYNFSWGTVELGYTSYFNDEGLDDSFKLGFRTRY